ncbi:MAG: WYL domain-containing protein [Candidatus Delongbacteria bacterium]|nr:WYL domain-containing protein [Candidatus Delongbacteria bacterium]
MSDKKTLVRIGLMLRDLITKGAIDKNKLYDKLEGEISRSTFQRALRDIKTLFNIPLYYDRGNHLYKVDRSSNKKLIEDNLFDKFSDFYNELYTHNDILFFYSFVKSMINSEFFFPPINSKHRDGSVTDFQSILRILESVLSDKDMEISNKIEYYMSEHYKIKQKVKFGNMINTIIQSFENKKLVKFNYNSKDLLFEPVKLIHYTAKWYLIGVVIESSNLVTSKKPRMFNLSQIDNIFKTSQHYVVKEYEKLSYSDSFGIIMSSKTETAKIRFYEPVNKNMKEILWFDKQKTIISTDKVKGAYTQFELPYPVKASGELIGRVLRYGSYAEVISPVSLRKEWETQIKKMYELIRD